MPGINIFKSEQLYAPNLKFKILPPLFSFVKAEQTTCKNVLQRQHLDAL